jgi:hypothetical protein
MVKSYNIGYVNWQFMSGIQQNLLDNGNKINIYLHNLPDNLLDMKEEKLGKNSKNVKFFNKHTKEKFIKSCDFIISDNPFSPIQNDLYKKHPYVVCPNKRFSKLEDDREFGKKLAEECGLTIPPSGHTFTVKEDAIKFLSKAKDGKYVLKGHSNTFIAPSREDAINFIEQDIYKWFKKTDSYLYIEGFIEGGYEVAFGCFFNGDKILDLSLITCEYKGAQNEDRSFVLTGEVGTSLIWKHFEDYPTSVKTTLRAAADLAKSCGYKGFIDINTIIVPNKKGGYTINFLEFTTRPGIPTEFEICSYFGSNYTKWVAYLSGIEKYFDLSPYFNTVGIGCALFSQSLGISSRDPVYKPLITGIEEAKSYCSVILQDSYEYRNKLSKKVQYKIANWDRALYCVKYQPLKSFLKHPSNIIRDVNSAMKMLKCWGHTYRDDVGSNLYDTVRLLDDIKYYEKSIGEKTKFVDVSKYKL